MNKEKFNAKDTTCGYNTICNGLEDCPVEKTTRFQLDTSIKLVHRDYKNKIFKMNLNSTRIFLDNCVKTAGDCPNSTKIRETGEELIKKHFGSNS